MTKQKKNGLIPNDKILDYTKLEVFADHNSDVDKKEWCPFKKTENIEMRKKMKC